MHQILHHVSRLPEGVRAPFDSAIMQSNAIVSVPFPAFQAVLLTASCSHRTTPKTPAELRSQFEALCRALSLDPTSPNVLDTLRDSTKVPFSAITRAIETDALGIENGTFRGADRLPRGVGVALADRDEITVQGRRITLQRVAEAAARLRLELESVWSQ